MLVVVQLDVALLRLRHLDDEAERLAHERLGLVLPPERQKTAEQPVLQPEPDGVHVVGHLLES